MEQHSTTSGPPSKDPDIHQRPPQTALTPPDPRAGSTLSIERTPTPDQPENISLGLLLSDITSLILLSLSTEKFLEKTQVEHPSTMFSTKTSRRETFQLLEAAGSTIDILYNLMDREQATGSNVIPQANDPDKELDSTLVKDASNGTTRPGTMRKLIPPDDINDLNSASSGGSAETIREGALVEQSTSTNDLGGSICSSRSGEYLSCESDISRSAEEYRSCEQLIPSPKKRPIHFAKSDIDIRRNTSTHSLSYLDRRSTIDSGIASDQCNVICGACDASSVYSLSDDLSVYLVEQQRRQQTSLSPPRSMEVVDIYEGLVKSTRACEADSSKDDSCLFETSQLRMEHEVVNRVQKLKLTVDQKLRDSLANLSNWYSEDDGTASLREHVKTMKIRYEKATTEEWKTGAAMHDVIMDKALATSVLAMENAQLGNEVNALRQELQLTYEQAKRQELKGLFVSRFSENLQELKLRDEESDSEESSSEMSTPDTQLLNASYVRAPHCHLREEFATPITAKELSVPGSSGKRRLKVPADLKAHSYPSLRSVSRSGSSMSDSSSGSSGSDSTDAVGCCSGIFDCFSRRRKRMREELLPEADKE